MRRQSDEVGGASPLPRLLTDVYERFGLQKKGVPRDEFGADPARHLRNLSRTLMGKDQMADSDAEPAEAGSERGVRDE